MSKHGRVQRKKTPAPLFQAIKLLRQHRDEEEALIFFSFAVIATAIIFDQGRAEEESPESWHPWYKYIHLHTRGQHSSTAFSWRLWPETIVAPLTLHLIESFPHSAGAGGLERGRGVEGWVIKADSSAWMSRNDRKVIAFEKQKNTGIAQFVLFSKTRKGYKDMGVLPQTYQNPYPENKSDLDFCADRNKVVF